MRANGRGPIVLALCALAMPVLFRTTPALAASPVTVDWSRQFGTASQDFTQGIARDAGGNLHLGGITRGSLFVTNPGVTSFDDAFVVKYDAAGAPVWTNQFGTTGNDAVFNVAADAAGNTYAVGASTGSLFATNLGQDDVILRKYDPAGNVAWSQQFGTIRSDNARGVSFDASGNVYVAGTFGVSIGINDAFVAKYSPTGAQLWLHQFGTTTDDTASAVKVDAAGNVIVAGSTSGAMGTPAGGYDAFVRKYDSNGNVLWTKQVGSSRAESVQGVAVDAGGNIFAVGRTQGIINGTTPGAFDDSQAFLFKLDSAGNFGWVQQLDATDEDNANDVSVDAAGNAYLAGHGLTGSNERFLIASYGPSGAMRWSELLDTPFLVDEFSGIVVDPDGSRAWLSGITSGNFGTGVNPGPGNEDALLVAMNVPEPSSALALTAVVLLLTARRRYHRAA
ncbi:MAG: hypothetical protein QOE14_15 [Humisphaera sp.]|nr:hypothetical protein [Humisphaera sp.]